MMIHLIKVDGLRLDTSMLENNAYITKFLSILIFKLERLFIMPSKKMHKVQQNKPLRVSHLYMTNQFLFDIAVLFYTILDFSDCKIELIILDQ